MQNQNIKQKNTVKSVCAICMALVMIFSSVCFAFAETPQAKVDAVYNFRDKQVVVTIELQNNPGIISFKGQLGYDKNAFKLVDVQDAGLLTGSLQDTSAEALKSDPYVLMWYDLNAVMNTTSAVNDTDSGKLVTLVFDTIDGKSGDFEFTFTHDKLNTLNLANEKVEFSVVQSSAVTIPAYIYAAEYKGNGKMGTFELYDRTKSYASGTKLFGVSAEYKPMILETVQ